MNTPFLQQVARHYLNAEGLEDYCFIFPNRRSGQFFSHYLQHEFVAPARGVRPRLMPRVTSINEFVADWTRTVAATDIEQMFALYDAYCAAMGDRAQEFDKFIYWAQLIISDFNDIDRSLADAGEVYRNLKDLHDLSSNYLSDEVKEKVRKIFGDNLFTAFFDTDADANLWRLFTRQQEDGDGNDEGEVSREFFDLWNALETIFGTYHQVLDSKGVVTAGRQLRLAAEGSQEQPSYARVVFVGFGVLSAAEVKLFDRFKAAGKADFWWDNAGIGQILEKAPHDPGALLIDGYCKRFGAMPLEPLETAVPMLRVVSVPSTVGQAKQAFNEVSRMMQHEQGNRVPGIETAVVLPDEGLLVPLLHSVHDVANLNVTLGYPLRSSGIVSLMHIVARLHHQATKDHDVWTYYREDINDILSHPLIKTYFTTEALDKATDLARTNRFRVPSAELVTLSFGDLFVPAMDSEEKKNEGDLHADYIDHLLSFCNLLMEKMIAAVPGAEDEDDDVLDSTASGDGVPMTLQQAFLDSYIDVLNQLKRALAECGQTIHSNTVFYLIDRLSAAAIVPFTGEPLRGLQVMGLLETRSLDFERVVILSMNERVFPRRRGINSFIPNYIRRAYGMSTIEQQEAIVAFNFYRLLNRSAQVTLIYDSSAQSMGSSEPSRYITQLEKIYGLPIEFIELNAEVETSSAIGIQVPNEGLDLEARYTRDPFNEDGKYLSASAINKYINCPLMFYMHYIQGLNDDNEVSDFMDYGTFGTIIHDTLSDCYDSPMVRDRGGLIDEGYLMDFKKKRLEAAVVRNIKKTYLHVPEENLATDTQPLKGEPYMLVEIIKSYVEFVIKHDLELIADKGPFTILECEQTHNMTPLEIGGERFNFTYKPDRIDRLADGTVRIVDYKTGKDETTFAGTPELDDLFDSTKGTRRKAILQLFLYSCAYLAEHHGEVASVMPVIYKLPAMNESGVWMKGSGRGAQPTQCVFSMDSDVARNFLSRMALTIHALYHDDFVQAPEGAKSCDYCRFIDMCRRAPSKSWS